MPLEVEERYDYATVWPAANHRYPIVVGTTIFWFPRDPATPAIWFDTATVTAGTVDGAATFPIPAGGAILAPDGYVYVTPWDDDRVVRVDPGARTSEVQDIDGLFATTGRWGVASHNGGDRIVARWVGFREVSSSGRSSVWLHIDTNDPGSPSGWSAVTFRPDPYTNAQIVSDTIYVPHNDTIYSFPKDQGSGYWIYVYPLVDPYNLVTDPVDVIGVPGSGVRYGGQMWLGQDGTTVYITNSGVGPLYKLDTVAGTCVRLDDPATPYVAARVDEANYGRTPFVHLGGGLHVGVDTNGTRRPVLFDESTETQTFASAGTVGPHRGGGTLAGNGRVYWSRQGTTSVTEYDPDTGTFTSIPREAGSTMQTWHEPVTVGGNVYMLEQTGVNATRVAWIQTAPPIGRHGIFFDSMALGGGLVI